jgi:hypothetical protein
MGKEINALRASLREAEHRPSAKVAAVLKCLGNGDTVDLTVIGRRVPRHNELYINKFGRVQRYKEVKNYSKSAQARVIVKEAWIE